MDTPRGPVADCAGSLEHESTGDQQERENEERYRAQQGHADPDQQRTYHQQHKDDDQEIALKQGHGQLAGCSRPRIHIGHDIGSGENLARVMFTFRWLLASLTHGPSLQCLNRFVLISTELGHPHHELYCHDFNDARDDQENTWQ